MRFTPVFLLFPLMLAACEQEAPPPPPAPQVVEAPKVLPQVVQAWLDKARFEMLKGDFGAAVQSYQGLLGADSASLEGRLGMAEAYRKMGEYDKALSLYTEVLKLSPGSLAAKEGGALTLIAKGDYENPVALLDEVLKADPSRTEALGGMGVLFSTRGMQKEAQQYFGEALKFAPADPVLLGDMGLSKALSGNYREAAGLMQSASHTAKPGSYERKRADMNTALVHAYSGRAEDALAIAGAYYGGIEYSQVLGLYAKLAADKKLATTYLHKALAGGRTYYEQGWDSITPVAAH